MSDAALTHGRHCSCSACAREDWAKIAAPCGMHGPSCPSVYAPIAALSYRLRLAWGRFKLAVSENWLRLRGVGGDTGIYGDWRDNCSGTGGNYGE